MVLIFPLSLYYIYLSVSWLISFLQEITSFDHCLNKISNVSLCRIIFPILKAYIIGKKIYQNFVRLTGCQCWEGQHCLNFHFSFAYLQIQKSDRIEGWIQQRIALWLFPDQRVCVKCMFSEKDPRMQSRCRIFQTFDAACPLSMIRSPIPSASVAIT